jgi:hypothetical protein
VPYSTQPSNPETTYADQNGYKVDIPTARMQEMWKNAPNTSDSNLQQFNCHCAAYHFFLAPYLSKTDLPIFGKFLKRTEKSATETLWPGSQKTHKNFTGYYRLITGSVRVNYGFLKPRVLSTGFEITG